MIDVRDLSKGYGDRFVLRRVSFSADRGEIVLLLGDNGAGKTTLVRSILGLIDYEGWIRVDGLDPLAEGKAARARIGYMPQSSGLHLELTVGETMRFYAALRRVPAPVEHRRLREVGLTDALESRVAELSIGMRQRLGFAVATLGDPPVLLLDEPTASLDARSRRILAERLRELSDRGKTILLSTHADGHFADLSARALRLDEGRLVA